MRKWFQKFSPAFREQVRKEKEQAAFSNFTKVPLPNIIEVRFYKRDELTTDLICCEADTNEKTWFFHEEMVIWDDLLKYLQELDGFDEDWFSKVAFPVFELSLHVAFRRTK